MKMIPVFILILTSTLFLTCQENQINPTNMNGEVFYNGQIYTVNPNQEWVEAMYVRDGVIQWLGSDVDAERMDWEDASWIDLEGAFVMPGIHDVHLHPLEAATDNFQFILDDQIEDAENYQSAISRANRQNPDSEWLLGWGHWIEVLLDTERAPRLIIDEIISDRPVAIMEQTSHSIWCNTKALELMGIEANTPNPTGGIIMRDAQGFANGLLIDNAGNQLINLALTPTPERKENDYAGLVDYALPELAKHGITSICDARTYWQREHHLTWKQLADENRLRLRVNLGLWAYPGLEDPQQLQQLKSLYENNPSSLLKINQIKVYIDGIIHNTTCAMHDDYLVNYFNLPSNNGLNYFTETRLTKYIQELEQVGFDFHIHAIGNRGVHEALNAIETGGTQRGRHRLTHVEYVDPQDIPRFKQLNAIADAQVVGDFTQPQNWGFNNYLIGAALNKNNIPIRSLQEADAHLTLSSDWDVSDLNPFIGIQNAVTRSPQAISLAAAIRAYTINAAYVMRQEDQVGTLEVGKEADFLILDRNLFDIPNNQINRTRVDATYFRGELIYER